MAETYVFDFFNLYIPDGLDYTNEWRDIRIEPLKVAEEFEEERSNMGSKHQNQYWKTAKAYIHASEEEAKEIATWIGYIYSFAQLRSIYWRTCYPYKKGYSHRYSRTVMPKPLKNRGPPLISGIIEDNGPFYTPDLSEFIDTGIETLRDYNEDERSNAIATIDMYLSARSESQMSARFLYLWIAIERNANRNYKSFINATGNEIFTNDERNRLQKHLSSFLDENLPKKQAEFLKNRLSKNYLYEHSTTEKVRFYLEYIAGEFDDNELREILEIGKQIRNPIVHNFYGDRLAENIGLLQQLQKMLSFVIFELLGVGENLQKRLLLTHLKKPKVSYLDTDRVH